MLVENPRAFLRHAYEQHFAMPAFNVANMEMARAVIEAAALERAPVIVQTYPGDLAHGTIGDSAPGALPGIIKHYAAQVAVPVFLHLDHGPGFDYDLRCLREGYSSVMFDGHELALADALAETAAIARVAHGFGAAVEGELGTFGGDQGSQEFTDPADVPLMMGVGVDMLAVSVGSEHGNASRLKLDLLRAIADEARGPLVIHGGSGVHPDDVRAALRLGVVKINIGAALARAWAAGTREALDAGEGHVAMLAQAMLRVHEEARTRLRLMGASGRA